MAMKPIFALALAAITLAGCGTDTAQNDMKSVLAGITQRGLKVDSGGTQAALDTQAMLAGTTGPLRLVAFDIDGATAGALQIETNGAYRTFATADRRTITFKDGLVTATRGLGNDLMSADIDASLALIRARKGGQAPRTMRYLNGENGTETLQFNCTVSTGAMQGKTRTMTEECRSEFYNFVASYQVTKGGDIAASHQWMSPLRGMARITVLRR